MRLWQVEIKLRLPNKEAHGKVQKALEKSHRVQHAQENIFFDGTQGELDSAHRTCRVRFYNGDKKAVITSKVRAPWHACSFLPAGGLPPMCVSSFLSPCLMLRQFPI